MEDISITQFIEADDLPEVLRRADNPWNLVGTRKHLKVAYNNLKKQELPDDLILLALETDGLLAEYENFYE